MIALGCRAETALISSSGRRAPRNPHAAADAHRGNARPTVRLNLRAGAKSIVTHHSTLQHEADTSKQEVIPCGAFATTRDWAGAGKQIAEDAARRGFNSTAITRVCPHQMCGQGSSRAPMPSTSSAELRRRRPLAPHSLASRYQPHAWRDRRDGPSPYRYLRARQQPATASAINSFSPGRAAWRFARQADSMLLDSRRQTARRPLRRPDGHQHSSQLARSGARSPA